MKKRKLLRRSLWTALVLVILLNVVAAFHAWRFTHVSAAGLFKREKQPEELSFGEKLKIVVTGVKNSKPTGEQTPAMPYETVKLQSYETLEAWWIKHPEPKGTIIVFHGYLSCKALMADKIAHLYDKGYNILAVDFMGSGNSTGLQTTIGYKEARDVKAAFDFVKTQASDKVYLFGTSLGAAAIMKTLNDDSTMQPTGIILECPFGTLYKTVRNRCTSMHVPAFPMAGLLVFWGGIENGFWAFGHDPQQYAKNIHCPTLLFWGEKDARVSKEETDAIYNNLSCEKKLITFPEAGHENYLRKYAPEWDEAVNSFLSAY